MRKAYDVIVAGAGPVGLFLAGELRLAGASVLVLEKEASPNSPWKAFPLGMRGLNAMSVEAMYRRGLLHHFVEPAPTFTHPKDKPKSKWGMRFAGHFAGIMLDAEKMDLSHWKFRLPGPALTTAGSTSDKIEAVLSERAEKLGVTIMRGTGVEGIESEDDTGVTVKAGDNTTFRGRWLVGCDGGRSSVRKSAGFDFIGTEPKYTAFSAKCDISPVDGLKTGFNTTKGGMYIYLPPNCVHLMDFTAGNFDRTQEITHEHFQEVFSRVTDTTNVTVDEIHLSTSSTDRCKQTSTYRKGRIILAGDAAHIHSPMGAQGMNLGLGDAMNLGWKLAETVKQEAKSNGAPIDMTLLDSYEKERHAIATWVLEWTRAQVSTLTPDLYGSAIRTVMQDLINTRDGTNLMIDRVWGLSQRYQLGDGKSHEHALVGSSAPDFELEDDSRLGPKFESGRGLLVDFEKRNALKEMVSEDYEGRVEYVGLGVKDTCGLRALLIRPDGIVAWVAEEETEPDMEAARSALERWFNCR